MWNFRYYAHCIELNCNFTIWLKVTVNSPFRRINLGSTPVTGGVTQTNKADKRSQRQAVTALYYYHTPPRPVPTLPKPHHPLLCTTTLASLVKGEVLSPEKIRATTGGIASPPSFACTNPCFAPPHLPPLLKVRCCHQKNSGDFRRDCLTTIPRLHQPFQNRTIPRKSTISFHNPTFSAHP